MFWILPHPTSLALLAAIPVGSFQNILVFWWKTSMLPLSVSRVFHLVPRCPEAESTGHGWRHEGLGSCPLLLVSPKTPPVSTGGFPKFHSWEDLALHPVFSLGSYSSASGPNLCGRWAAGGGNQLSPKKENTVWYFKLSFPPYWLFE